MLVKTEEITFEEMVENPGKYVADDFAEGVCLETTNEGCLLIVEYQNKDDIYPRIAPFPFFKGLLKKEYRKVLNRNSLFKE